MYVIIEKRGSGYSVNSDFLGSLGVEKSKAAALVFNLQNMMLVIT